jgi:hypothetical protein
MRAVTSATAAAILGIERKTFDNLVARLDDPEFPRGRQGVERRIPVALLPQLLLSAELSWRLAVPYREAFQLTKALVRGQQPGAPYFRIDADLDLLRAEIDRQLESAVEAVVRRPRGRPRKSAR